MASTIVRGLLFSTAAGMSYGSARLGVWSLDTRNSKESLDAVKRTVKGEIDYTATNLATPPVSSQVSRARRETTTGLHVINNAKVTWGKWVNGVMWSIARAIEYYFICFNRLA